MKRQITVKSTPKRTQKTSLSITSPLDLWTMTITMRLKYTCGSDLTFKVASKCLNVRERVKVVGRSKDGPLPYPVVL